MIRGKLKKEEWLSIEARRLAKLSRRAFMGEDAKRFQALAESNYKAKKGKNKKEQPVSDDVQKEAPSKKPTK